MVALVGGLYALAADPPAPKPLEPPPPVTPARDSTNPTPPVTPETPPAPGTPATPGTPPAPGTPGATEQPAKPSTPAPLPDELPVLVEPARPELIPRRTAPRKVRAYYPLVEEEKEEGLGPTNELPSFLEMVEPTPQTDVARYVLEDPLARTALSNVMANAELFYDGFGGIIRPLDVVTLPQRPLEAGRGFHLGAMTLRPGISGALIGSRRRGDGLRRDEGSAVLGANIGGIIGTPDTGRFLTLDYGIARTFETEQALDSDLDQSLFLAGHLAFGNLSLGIGIDFASLSGFSRDTGSDLQRDYLTVALTSSLQITPKTSLDWDIATPNGHYPSGSGAGSAIGNSSGFTSTHFVNYEYSAKSTVGMGFTLGLLQSEEAKDQVFERILTRVGSTPTPFLSYAMTAGVEFRDTGYKRVTHPLFSLSAIWTPRERTTVTLTGEQRIQISAASANSNFVSTSVVLGVSQRLGDRFSVGLAAGFENAKYESIGFGDFTSRRDRTYLGQFSVSALVAERMNVSASVSYVRTESNDSSTYTAQCAIQASFFF